MARWILNSGDRPETIASQQPRGELQQARDHAYVRNALVARVLCFISVMRSARHLPDGVTIHCPPRRLAVPQDYQAGGGQQAAHYLPGTLSATAPGQGERYLWDFPPAALARARQELLDLFGKTEDLSTVFNHADTAAEARRRTGTPGLKQVFQQVAQEVAASAPVVSKLDGSWLRVVNRPVVEAAYHRWVEGSQEAYRAAAEGKQERIATGRPAEVRTEPRYDPVRQDTTVWTAEDLRARQADLSRQVTGRQGSVDEFADQASYLRAYLHETTPEFPLSESTMTEIASLFWTRP